MIAAQPDAVAQRRAELQAKLNAARAGFDPYYVYSDDHSVYRRGQEQEKLISYYAAEIRKLDGAP